jgi:hypothetical protein
MGKRRVVIIASALLVWFVAVVAVATARGVERRVHIAR